MTAQAASDTALPVLERYLEKQGLAGGVLLISAPYLRKVGVSGVADQRRDTPVQADTRFYVASIGKMAVPSPTSRYSTRRRRRCFETLKISNTNPPKD
jgi:hypothetical protein